MEIWRRTRLLLGLGAVMALCGQAIADGPVVRFAQSVPQSDITTTSQGVLNRGDMLEQGRDAPRANPDVCGFCYQQLAKDNRDCETLKGQDWQICREAASSAYRRCSQGC